MKAILLFILLLVSVTGWTQQKSVQKNGVLFDPSFWKEELRLNNHQYKRMQDINETFYNQLINAFKVMKEDRNAFRSAFSQYSESRNTQLWQTMNARQKRKWKKIAFAEQSEVKQTSSYYE